MKQYQHIDYFGKNLGHQTIGFEKLDGSNLRFEWNKKRGFYKFGTKNCMMDENTEIFGQGITIFLKKYSEELDKVFRSKIYRDSLSFVCFAEFIGPNSKFGQHDPNDKMDMVLFDIDQYKKGFIPPKEFIKSFGHLHIPKVVYEGNLNQILYDNVCNNTLEGYEGQLNEGIICKTVLNNNKFGNLHYCKIKTKTWLDELKARYGEERLKEEFI